MILLFQGVGQESFVLLRALCDCGKMRHTLHVRVKACGDEGLVCGMTCVLTSPMQQVKVDGRDQGHEYYAQLEGHQYHHGVNRHRHQEEHIHH